MNVTVEDRGYITPCHVWQRAVNSSGYGVVREGSKLMLAHRVAYRDHHGHLPEQLDHLCTVTRCVRVDHLEPVTQAENVRRGRTAKLTQAQAQAIRFRRALGEGSRQLAREFGVTQRHVRRIANGEHWA